MQIAFLALPDLAMLNFDDLVTVFARRAMLLLTLVGHKIPVVVANLSGLFFH